MIRDEYSLYKLVHHGRILSRMRSGLLPPPIQAHVIPTNRCNQDCAICAYRRDGFQSNQNFNAHDQMTTAQLMGLVADLAALGNQAVQFTGGGEPLLHPDICQTVESSMALGMSVAMVTNGVLLGDRQRKTLSEASWIRVSLDAATPEAYSRVKNSPKTLFTTVCRNIESMAKAKSKGTILGVGFVVQEYNWREIIDATELARELGADNIRISAAFTPWGSGYFDAFVQLAREQSSMASACTRGDFTVFNLFNERLDELFMGRQDYPYCHSKDLVPYIGADMNVYSCCVKAYTDHGLMGNIAKTGLAEFWASDQRMDRYSGHDPRMDCPHPCMFEHKNKFINYCVKSRPRHMEFI